MLGSLLSQLASRQGEIPEAIVKDFRKERWSIGGGGIQSSRDFEDVPDNRNHRAHIHMCWRT